MQHGHALRLAARPIPVVRIGFVGLGARGTATLCRYLCVEGVEVVALCDLNEGNLATATALLTENGRPIPYIYSGTEGWHRLCERTDVDLVYICTDWLTHTPMALYAMEQGKHVALEVPAATTVEECWQLVDCAERTRLHCVMLENCCYDGFHLASYTMAKRGLLGELTHLEGAYIHDLRDKYAAEEKRDEGSWMGRLCGLHGGNPYPTHGIGPICQLLDIHRGDRLDYLVSVSPQTPACAAQGAYINHTLIRTVKGKSILLQYDVTTPRPYSRMQTICGTKGFVQKYPRRCIQLDGGEAVKGDATEALMEQYAHPLMVEIQREGIGKKVPNLMNYTMDCRLIHCLRRGLPLDMDVYDAAEWSCIAELTERSVRGGGIPVKIPDFTRGRWEVIEGYAFSE